MTLSELSTPFERRRIIQYGKDGNTPVRHWHEMQHVTGPLYKGREKAEEYGGNVYDTFLVFNGVKDGLRLEYRARHPEQRTVEQYAEELKKCGYDTPEHFLSYLDACVEEGRHIGNAMIEFVRQIDPERAERYARHRAARLAAEDEKQKAQLAQREAERRAEEERRKAEMEKERALLLGWADEMSPMQYGRAKSVLDVRIRVDAKAVMTRRDFIIMLVRDGWAPHKEENVISYYGSRWDMKESAPRSEYTMCKGDRSYTVSKTEYDFALFLSRGRNAS